MYIVTVIIILILIFLFYTLVLKEKFENIKIEDGVITYDHTIEAEERDLVKYLVSLIIENINKQRKPTGKLEIGNLDRLIKTKISENETNYSVRYFIYNKNNYTNRKYLFDLTLNTETNALKVNAIKGGSSLKPVIERHHLSERGATLFKPKEEIPPNATHPKINLEFINLLKEERSTDNNYVDNPEDMNKNIELDKAIEIENTGYEPFPSRQVTFEWDTFGISHIEPPKTCIDGIFHGNNPPKIVASYNPTLFTGNDEEYEWLFDLTSDSASRPVGITGATG